MKRSIIVSAAAVALVAVAAQPAFAAHHEEAEPAAAVTWEQGRVTQLAGEFASAVKGVRKAVSRAGDPGIASMQARAHHEFEDTLRLIQNESRHLAAELAEGQGLEETLPVYRRLRVLIRDARDLSQKLYIGSPVQAEIDAARAKLEKLAAYYPEV